MKKDVYAVILAGGKGTRLWPLSKKGVSKSFISIAGKKPMVLETVERIRGLVEKEHMIFVVDYAQKKALKSAIKGISKQNILLEPYGRSTASAVGLAAIRLPRRSILVVLPTDAMVDNPGRFKQTLKKGIDFVRAKEGSMICVGIKPNGPSSAYGYIKVGSRLKEGIYAIDRFVEKPTKRKAEALIKQTHYLWNAGIFVFRAGDILSAMRKYSPELYRQLDRIKNNQKTITDAYSRMRNISIDFQIMEKAENLYCVKANFGWSDLGSWVSMEELFGKDRQGNVSFGNVKLEDTKNSFIYNSGEPVIGVVGADNMIIVRTSNGMLVCSKKDAEKVKRLKIL